MNSPVHAPTETAGSPPLARRALWALFAAATMATVYAGSARGADRWMSRPSYYSHHVPPHLAAHYPQPVLRTAYRPAFVSDQPGFSTTTAVRINRVQFRFGGASDTTLFTQQNLRFGP